MTKLKVLAVGNGAGNILNKILETKPADIESWAINTDKQCLNSSFGANKLLIGKKIAQELGAGGNPNIGKLAMEENITDILSIIKDTEIIITVTCLGGGTGGGATPVIVQKIAEETDAVNLVIVTLPFSWEGFKKTQQAMECLENIKNYADKVIVIRNNQLMSLITEKITCKGAFDIIDKVAENWVTKINNLICGIKIADFNSKDLKKFFRYKGNLYMETIDIEEDNLDMLEDKIKQSKILSTLKPPQSSAMIVYVKGSLNIKMNEAQKISDKLSVLCNAYTQIYFCMAIGEDIPDGKFNISLLIVNNG